MIALLDRARALPADARLRVVLGAGAPVRTGEAWEVPGLGDVVVVSHLEDGRTVVDARAGDVARAMAGQRTEA